MKKILIIERDPQADRLYLGVFQQKYEVEFASCIVAIQNRIEQHQDDGGLEYYDAIIMDPYISHHPLYSFEETFASMQTGWFIYRDFMQSLMTTVIIWTHPIEQYNYNKHNYPDRFWGENVAGVFRKDYASPYLLDLIEKYARK